MRRHRYFMSALLFLLCCSILLNIAFVSRSTTPRADAAPRAVACLTFKETSYTACGMFLTYWQSHGGLAQFGFPISPVFNEKNAEPPAGDGKSHPVQYFQRARFEAHPENQPPYDVLLGLLGAEQVTARYPSGFPPAIPQNVAPVLTDALPLPSVEMNGAITGRVPVEQRRAMLPAFYADVDKLAATAPVYTISVQPDLTNARYVGHQIVDYVNTTPVTLTTLVFRLLPNAYGSTGGDLIITAAAIDGQRTNGTAGGSRNSYYTLPLPAPLLPGATTRVELAYNGSIPRNYDPTNYGQLRLTSDTLNMAQFYPMLDVWENGDWARDSISYTTDLTYAASAFYTVAVSQLPHTFGTGVSSDDTLPGIGRVTRFVTGPVREFAFFTGANYALVSAQAGDSLVSVVYDSRIGSETTARRHLDLSVAVMNSYNARFGQYPYAKIDVLFCPIRSGGIEWPTIVQIDSKLFGGGSYGIYSDNPPAVMPGYGDDTSFTIAHELAHQWWYSLVGSNPQQAAWLDEGLTNYSVYLLPTLWANGRDNAGAQRWSGWIGGHIGRTIRRELYAVGDIVADQPATGYDQTDGSLTSIDLAAYQKPPLFYDTYRRTYGDAAFLRFVQNWFAHHRYGLARPADLLAEMQAAAPGNDAAIAALYRRWLQERHANEDVW